MISIDTLRRAVEEGLITTAQADGLRKLEMAAVPSAEAWAAAGTLPPDEESLRLVNSFSDIFVTIGLFLFFGAAGFFLRRAFGDAPMWAMLAGLAWLLAEFFTRRRRMALPSIVLLGVFVVSIFFAGLRQFGGEAALPALFLSSGPGAGQTLALAGLVTTAFAALHYWRFRVPITIAAAAAALSAMFLGLVLSVWPHPGVRIFNSLVLACGLAVFVAAMRFDSSDRARTTRRTDIAFWLHLLAAPLIVHPVIALFFRSGAAATPLDALAILALFFGFAFVAVVVDRRALLVSGLTYAGFALGSLLRQTGLSDSMIPATLLALGVFVLLLSAGWLPLRRFVLQIVPSALTHHFVPLAARPS
jgi:hypothetical protein